MATHHPAETTAPTPTSPTTPPVRRLLLAVTLLALAMALLLVAGAGSALAASSHAAPASRAASATDGGKPAEERPRSGDRGVSPAVPLVFAGIVILAASGPWLPPRSRYVCYRVDRRW
jgi:hypothetical protein